MTRIRNLYFLWRSYSATKIAAIYFIISFLWIFFSDRFIQLLARNYHSLAQLQTYKGWFFVSITTVLFYYLIRKEIKKKNEIIKTINESESWYNTLLSNIPKVDVFLFDLKLIFILAQGKQVLKFGLDPDEMRGKSLNNLKMDEKVQSMLKDNFEYILTGKSVAREFKYNDEWYELRGVPVFGNQENILAGIAIFINITQQKKNIDELIKGKNEFEALYVKHQSLSEELEKSNVKLQETNRQLSESEQKYRTFISQTTEGVYRIELHKPLPVNLDIDEQVKHIYTHAYLAECNRSFVRMYGYKNTADLTGKSLDDFQGGKDAHDNIQTIKKFIESGYKLVNSESYESDRSGNMKYFTNNIIGIVNDGYMTRMWGTQSDITQRKKYEQDIIAARKKAEESDKLKSAFLANISHEVRTPLNGIMGFSELLRRNENDKDKIMQYTATIKNSSQQLLNIINDILDISQLESNELKLSATEFSLNKLMDEIYIFYKDNHDIEEKKLTVRYIKPLQEEYDIIIADRTRINQIMMNLISNAIKFTESGYIEFGYFPVVNNKIKFFVKDSGIGIPENNHTIIFERFRQLDFDLSRKYGGTGLGLSIANGLVKLMKGNMQIISTEHEGATFYFNLPCEIPENNKQMAVMEQVTGYFKGYSVLVISNDDTLQHQLGTTISHIGMYTYRSDSGVIGIDKCMDNSRIDLVLLDTGLTDMDAMIVLKTIKKIKSDLPVIVLTNNLNEKNKKNYFNSGGDDYIKKPVASETLSELMIRFLNIYYE